MKSLRLWAGLGILGLLAALGSLVLSGAQEAGERGFRGGSYLTTITDSTGNFASRGVMTLHADQTVSATDSNQNGPDFFFTSQLGSWRPAGNRRIVAKTLDFDLPPNTNDVARLNYNILLSPDHRQIAGTVTLSTFPLQGGDPINGQGTLIGTFNFTGEWIRP